MPCKPRQGFGNRRETLPDLSLGSGKHGYLRGRFDVWETDFSLLGIDDRQIALSQL